jgi:membrane-associated phospholipid phosphatase
MHEGLSEGRASPCTDGAWWNLGGGGLDYRLRPPESSDGLAPAWAPAAVIIALALTSAIGALVWSTRQSRLDAWAVQVLSVSRNGFPYRFASRLDDSARLLAVIAGSLAIALIAWALLRRWDAVVAACLAAPVTVGAEMLIKLAGRRSLDVESFSYPSGRVAVATSLVLVLVLVLRSAAVQSSVRAVVAALGSIWVLTIAWARVATSQHLLTDVVGGMCLGVAVPLAVVLLLTALRQRISLGDL